MPVELSVADVRKELLQKSAGREPGSGQTSNLMLGTVFHQVFADLVGSDEEHSGLRVIVESGPDRDYRVRHLLEHTWRRLLAPRLLCHAAALQGSGDQVLMLWRATRELATWLVELVTQLLEDSPGEMRRTEHLRSVLQAEVPLECELREPGWTDAVRLVGIADSIVWKPKTRHFCAIELKLGRGTPVADLGQAALYHLILTRAGRATAGSALALLRFSPEPEEVLVMPGSSLEQAQRRLVELVGQMAGVVREPPVRLQPKDMPPAPCREHTVLGQSLQRALREQGVEVEMLGPPLVGPRFLRFEVRLAARVKVEALRRCTAEVQHRLELRTEPSIVKDAGRLYIDLPRPDPQVVKFSSVAAQLPQPHLPHGSARLPVGVDPAGQLHFTDLSDPSRAHVLVAGSTGSGKTEWLRMSLAGLLASNTPDTLRLVVLDPKLSAFGDLERSRYLWHPDSFWIPGHGRLPTDLLQELISEMERRYEETRRVGTDTLSEYVRKTGRPCPRVIVVCDEYFALVSPGREEKKLIEQAVSLLAAKSRAAGIHLLLATQHPGRDTITNVIQNNLPCRVALSMQSPIESRMILNAPGAERLTGSGDLLYRDVAGLVRLQAPYLPEDERRQWLRK